jgi:hypothetical protein
MNQRKKEKEETKFLKYKNEYFDYIVTSNLLSFFIV